MLRVHLFGGLALAWCGDPLPTLPSKAASLFAYLVTYRNRPHTRGLLAGAFWPDLPEATARRRLSQALWQIRQTLDAHPILMAEGDTVQWNPDLALWLDVAEFTQHYAQSTTGSPEALQHCESCVEHYRGEFLAGYYDDWVGLERERLREMLLAALGRLLEGFKGRGEYERALLYARRLAAEDPWHEEAHREVMRLYHLLGRDAEALKQFEICRQTLTDELGVEPSPETTALVGEITTRSGLPQPPLLPTLPRPPTTPLLERPDRLPLVGRQSELAELLRQVESALEGSGGLTVLYGEAGVGKSRLLRELADNAQWRGVQTVWGRCCELAAPPAYQPLAEALRAGLSVQSESTLQPLWRATLARLLPELATDKGLPPALSPAEERRRLLEAITRAYLALAETAPHLVLLEDAQWMDLASLEALRYLLPRLGESPLLIVITVRTEELADEAAAAMSAIESTHLPRRIELGRLDRAETGELVQRVLNLEQPASRFSARLYVETEGNPFFLIETLRALMEEGLLSRDETGAWGTPWDESTEDYAELPLPAGVAQSIARRLSRLPALLQQLLDLAAVIGRGVDFELWLAASGRDEETLLTAGDELCARGLLLAAEPDYVFAHDQIRRVTYERLAAPRRRFYHRQVVQALNRLNPDEPAALAYHWTQAEEWDQAADYHQRAGNRAREVYANAEAVEHYSQALEALERLPDPVDPARILEQRLAREAVHALQGERAAQAEDLTALEALAERLDDDHQRAAIALRQADYYIAISDCPTARHYLERALDLAQTTGDRQSEALGLHLLANVYFQLGNFAAAQAHYEQALRIYRAIGDHRGEVKSLGKQSMAYHLMGDYLAAQDSGQQALALCRTVGDRRSEGYNLLRLGRFARDRGHLVTAREHTVQALGIAHGVGDRYGEAYYLLELGNLHSALGDYPLARETLGQAVTIFQHINQRRGQGFGLVDLGLVYHLLGDDGVARDYCEQGRDILHTIGDRWGEAASLRYLGLALEGLGDLDAAAEAHNLALVIYREIAQQAFAMEALAGLAQVALAQGKVAEALKHIEEILAWVVKEGVAGIEFPFRVYLTAYRVLAASGDAERAGEVLATAHTLLMERAGRLEDEATCQSFLENVAAHREIVAAYRESQAVQQERQTRPEQSRRIAVHLPKADAPLGRPLRDDEFVMVTWTIDAPEDASIQGKVARRRQRILRLLAEAKAQGAAPRDQDLAAVLCVSLPTLRRDMGALRAEGHALPTRWRKMIT